MIYWNMYTHACGVRFLIAATDNGLCFTGSDGCDEQELKEWVGKKRKGQVIVQNEQKLVSYKEAFDAFFDKSSTTLSMPLDIIGTPFQQQVWEALKTIPYGETCSYADIAQAIGKPTAVRAVGGAIGANPVMIVIPCHRVIGKNGTLTGFRGGLQLKERLLQFER